MADGMDISRESDGQAPLRLFWWREKPNFGDALSAEIVAHVSGREVVHSGARTADMVAIGSLLRVVSRKHADPVGGPGPWIWGSGLMSPVNTGFVANVQVALLRGPVTAALLKLKTDRLGDPGLLAQQALPNPPPRQDRVGVLLHHRQMEDAALVARLTADPAVDLIDVRGGVREVCHRIEACAHVYSASLHGLIVADSYGVANTWIDPGDHGWLKYADYAGSVGRHMPVPLSLDAIGGHMKSLRDGDLTYADGIARARETVTNTFPAPLRAGAHQEKAFKERA